MANKNINAVAGCPFFCAETEKSVSCEGIVGRLTVSRFKYRNQKRTHEDTYCKSEYSTCPIFIANMQKY